MSSGNREHAPPSRTSSPAGTRDRRPGVERWWDEAVLARVRIIRAIPSTGPALASALLLVNVVLGVLPVAFVVATSVVIGQVPAAVAAGWGHRPGPLSCGPSWPPPRSSPSRPSSPPCSTCWASS
ncbi:hypothetical protein HFP72_29285 [Nocardiopsis sp. ARC36]